MAFGKENTQVPDELQNHEIHKGSTICATGAAGFIGSWLIMHLLERGYTVRATMRDTGGFIGIGLLLCKYQTQHFNGNDLGLHNRNSYNYS